MRVLGHAAPLAVTALLSLLPPCLVTAQPPQRDLTGIRATGVVADPREPVLEDPAG